MIELKVTFESIEKTAPKRDKPIERTYDFTMWKLTNSMVAEIYNSQLEGRNPDWERFKKKSA